MKGLKTIQNDQMVKNDIFGQIRHQKAPLTPWRLPVSDNNYLELVGKVSKNLSQY